MKVNEKGILMINTILSLFGLKKVDKVESYEDARKRVNCINFVPPTMATGEPHCDMGDGREGNCTIYYYSLSRCTFYQAKVKPLTKEEISVKVRVAEKTKIWQRRCVGAGICPDCGDEIVYLKDHKDPLNRGCVRCNKVWIENSVL